MRSIRDGAVKIASTASKVLCLPELKFAEIGKRKKGASEPGILCGDAKGTKPGGWGEKSKYL
jgi:hypothetical protein